MLHRVLRKFCLLGLGVIIGTGIIAQFWTLGIDTPRGGIYSPTTGLIIIWVPDSVWGIVHDRVQQAWNLKRFVKAPIFQNDIRMASGMLFIPWWLLLLTSGGITAIVWRLTRRRKDRHAFPIETTGA